MCQTKQWTIPKSINTQQKRICKQGHQFHFNIER